MLTRFINTVMVPYFPSILFPMDYTFYCNEEENNMEKYHYHVSKGQKQKNEEFKSKNLITERKRRLKTHEGLMALRTLVPNITNLKKETTIDDAITYIKELKNHENALVNQLAEMEAAFKKEVKQEKKDDITYGIEKLKIKDEVKVTQISENKLWVEIICENKPGVFTRLMETISDQGFEVTDMNFTSSKGLTLVLFGMKVTNGEMAPAKQVKLYFKKLMRGFIDREDGYQKNKHKLF